MNIKLDRRNRKRVGRLGDKKRIHGDSTYKGTETGSRQHQGDSHSLNKGDWFCFVFFGGVVHAGTLSSTETTSNWAVMVLIVFLGFFLIKLTGVVRLSNVQFSTDTGSYRSPGEGRALQQNMQRDTALVHLSIILPSGSYCSRRTGCSDSPPPPQSVCMRIFHTEVLHCCSSAAFSNAALSPFTGTRRFPSSWWGTRWTWRARGRCRPAKARLWPRSGAARSWRPQPRAKPWWMNCSRRSSARWTTPPSPTRTTPAAPPAIYNSHQGRRQ